MIAKAIYILCAVASTLCAVLLFRGYRATNGRAPLLLWSTLCFAGIALNNVILVIDLVVVPDIDLSLVRSLPALAAMLVLLIGLIWERG